MKAIIFAGGVGTRLWPLSRKNSPKQFEKVIGDKSTLQLSVERLLPDFKPGDIYISTNLRYLKTITDQLTIPKENIIGEPESKDVGPAVGLATAYMVRKFPHEPIVILWSDHLVKKENLFRKLIKTAKEIIDGKKGSIVFITQKPRFASQNLGWIEYNKVFRNINGFKIYNFSKIIYRPNLNLAQNFLNSGHHAWNLGYFVTTPDFLWRQFKEIQPEMYAGLNRIQKSIDTKDFENVLKEEYSKFEKISFDNAILEKIDKKDALVISENLEWSDVGAWEALKEALQSTPSQNVVQGKTLVNNCRDSLVYNYTDQMVVALDLDGMLIVNTHDVVLICNKNSVPKIKKLVEDLNQSENKHLT